jgi:hypothetical protein
VQETNTTNQGRLGGSPALTGIRENWTKELVRIPASFYNSSNVRFRFEFSSDPDGGSSDFEDDMDDGFYIDDFKIVKSTVALITLPVEFISFTGQLLPDNSVRLQWEAIPDQQHDYFEMEKSADGSNFVSIGRGPATAPFWGIDTAPFTGNNFYRIKQVDKDGTISYSNTIVIYYEQLPSYVAIYPNPVSDMLHIRLSVAKADQYFITITDMAGRKVKEERIIAPGTELQGDIDMRQQASQLYILAIRNSKNELIATQKLVKK